MDQPPSVYVAVHNAARDDAEGATHGSEMPNFQVPEEMRDFAEKSVEQARKAFDGFLGAAHKAIDSVEGRASRSTRGRR